MSNYMEILKEFNFITASCAHKADSEFKAMNQNKTCIKCFGLKF